MGVVSKHNIKILWRSPLWKIQASIYHITESTIVLIIIACGSTDFDCAEGRQTVAVCGLPSSQ